MEKNLGESYRKVALNLLTFRKTTRLDQVAFAKKCGVSRRQYQNAEGAHHNMTLETLLKICIAFDVEIGDLFKDPFSRALKIEQREKVNVHGSASKFREEKFISSLNKNTTFKKWIFGAEQVRSIRLQKQTKFEILVLKGEVTFVFSSETNILKEGQQISLDFNPQWSFDEKATEQFKLGSRFGAEVLLIQTVVH